ncbi:hypothetical protein LshimejAT787_1402770 [Lyophyllum shimeji]|uniref:Uncharacterized protein n=1 Tax=Lyophyllum shimeji TaxID=47721 RepID=A0A9P3UTM3_LYOSH|nr:hypothetical protein LshimejAT787_1402770 [Lyophyllum shimeji]
MATKRDPRVETRAFSAVTRKEGTSSSPKRSPANCGLGKCPMKLPACLWVPATLRRRRIDDNHHLQRDAVQPSS